MNPLCNNNMMSNVSSMKQMMKMANPMMLLNQLSQSNPQLQPILQALNNGANPKQLVMQECQRRGIDFNDFVNQLK